MTRKQTIDKTGKSYGYNVPSDTPCCSDAVTVRNTAALAVAVAGEIIITTDGPDFLVPEVWASLNDRRAIFDTFGFCTDDGSLDQAGFAEAVAYLMG